MSLFRKKTKKSKKVKGFKQRLKPSAFSSDSIRNAMIKTHKIISADVTDESYLKYILAMQYALHTLDDLKSNLNKLDDGIYDPSIKNMFRNKEHAAKWKSHLLKLLSLEKEKLSIINSTIEMLDNEYMENEYVKNFYSNIAKDNNSNLLMNNIDLSDKFFEVLVKSSTQKRIEEIMEGLSKETRARQFIVRSDQHIFYIKYQGKQEYFTVNIPSLKEIALNSTTPIEDILIFDPDKGRTVKVRRKSLHMIYEGADGGTDWIDEKLKLIK